MNKDKQLFEDFIKGIVLSVEKGLLARQLATELIILYLGQNYNLWIKEKKQ